MSLSKPQTVISDDLPKTVNGLSATEKVFVNGPASVEDVMTFMKTLTDLLEGVLPKQLIDSLSYSVCSSLIASLLGLITTSAAMLNTTVTRGLLHGAVLLAQLNSFVSSLYTLLKAANIKFSMERAFEAVKLGLDEILSKVTPNSFEWLASLFQHAMIIILTGLTAFKVVDIKHIIETGSLIRANDVITKSFTGITKFILSDLCHLDITGEAAYFKEVTTYAERSIYLASVPYHEYITKPELYKELQEMLTNIIPVVSKRVTPQTSASLRSACSILVNHVSVLNTKLASIREALNAELRQETVGIYLAGKQAVGKSSLITYIWNKIAKDLGYSTDQYNLSLNNDSAHFAPYAMQHVGIYNEFGFYRDQDPIIPKLTGIVSGDPFNMPGAALEHKVQPANFKAVFLTSNMLSPKLTGACDKAGVEALWDRFLRFEIIDPNQPSRNQPCPWRKPDFSHLQVNLWRTNDVSLVPPEDTKVSMTIDQMIDEIKTQLINREINFLKTRAKGQFTDDYIQTRLQQLQPTPNAGRTFFVIRYQGVPSVGKTADATTLAVLFRQGYKLPTRYIYSFDEPSLKVPALYIIDDTLPQQEHKEYLKWVNTTHERSVIIIVTNTILKPTGIWNKYIHIKSDAPSGIVRRLGLSGATKYEGPDGIIKSSPMPHQYTINKDTTGQCTCGPYTNGNINNYILGEYNQYLLSLGGIIKTQVPYTGDSNNWDLHATFKTISDMQSSLSNKGAIMRAIAEGKLTISTRLVNFASTMERPLELLSATDVTSAHEMEHNATVLATFFERRIPNIRLNFTVGDKTFVVNGRTLHLPYTTDITVLSTDDEFIITNMSTTKLIPKSTALNNYFSEMPMLLPELADDIPSYLALNQYISNHENKKTWFTWFSLEQLKSKIEEYKSKGVLSFAMDNKVLSVISFVAIAITTCLTAKRLWNWAFSRPLIQNTSEDEDSPDSPRYNPLQDLRQRYRAAVFEKKGTAAMVQQEAVERGMGPLFAEWEMAYRSNARNTQDVVNLLNNTPTETAVEYLQQNPKSLKSLVEYHKSDYQIPNMVAIDDIITPIPTLTKIMSNKLIKNYARIDAIGSCYALGLRDKLFVTVSHLFENTETPCKILYNGVSYQGKCIVLNRPRDLAIVRVIDKNFPTLVNIESMLPSLDDHIATTSATFVRPLPNELSYHTDTVRYIPKSIITRTSSKRFSLNENFYIMNITTMHASQQVYQRGDCGFPIVIYKDNKWLIMGIHNSYHQMDGTMYFSALHKEDLNYIRSELTPNSDETLGHPLDADIAYTTTPFMRSKMDVLPKSSVFQDVSDLPFFGFNPNFAPTSKPTHKKKYLALCEEITPCPVLPSALDLTDVEDTSALVKNTHGTPHPLLTQAVKYSRKTPEYGTGLNPTITEIVLDHIRTYYNMHYKVDSTPLKLGAIINGFDCLQGFDMTTSVGMNIKLQHRIHIKRPEDNPDVLFINKNKEGEKPYYAINIKTKAGQQLNADFDLYDRSIQKGIPICMIIKDNAKVELLPKEKVLKGKVRLFNEIDLAINMVLKKYFGRFVEKVIANHSQTMYAIGYNPYLDANYYHKALSKQGSTFISTDYASLDKTIPKELIKFFVYTVLDGYSALIKEALYKTLANTYHVIEGSMYYVDCGNESGSYVTTLMNCFVVHFNTWYTCCRVFKEQNFVLPTFKELTNACNMRILGDDCIRAITGLPINFEELKKDASLMNLELTAPKQEGTLSFCSRVFSFEDGIIYPQLKKESIIGCLFYFTELTPVKIEQNMAVALFEASLHPKPFFLKVSSMCDILARKYDIVYDRLSYEAYRSTFREYVTGYSDSPVFQGQVTPNSQQKNTAKTATAIETTAIMNYKMWLNEYIQRSSLVLQTQDTPLDDQWFNTITINYPGGLSITTGGTATTKLEAKAKSAEAMFRKVSAQAPIEAYVKFDGTTEKPYPYAPTNLGSDGLNQDKDAFSRVNPLLPTFARVEQNADTPIEPATMNQAAKFQGVSSLPSSVNPQPTGQVPAMTSSGEDVVAAVSGAQVQVLNPVGAPDTSTMGAIQFDIKDLIYQQFLDSDTEIEINADLPAGSIIAQIPYALANNIYTNPYIRAWGALHERYTGSFQYRFTLIGNPLFSGAVGIAWYPKRITTSTAPVSELMKYAYSAKGVTMPWNIIHTLHDARKDNFYREVTDDVNLDDRPHLVLYLHMSLQNPLQPGVITRVRIASKLSNAAEPNPFRAMLPTIPNEPTVSFQATSLASPSALQEVLPGMFNLPLWIYTDGNKAVGTLPGVNRNELQYYRTDNQRGVGYSAGGRSSNGSARTQTLAEANADGWSITAAPGSNVTTTLLTLHNMSQAELKEIFVELNLQGLQYQGVNSSGRITASEWATLATAPIQHTPRVLIYARTVNSSPVLMETINQGDVTVLIHVVGWHKYTTRYGVLIFAITQVTQTSGTIMAPAKLESYSAMNMAEQLAILQIEAQVGGTSPDITELPAGYNLLQFTEIPPTAIASEGMRVPTASCNNDMVQIFSRRAEGLVSTQCLQFRLIDLRSSRVVATVRYLQEYGVFVINNAFIDAYRVIPQSSFDLAISLVSTVERTTDFQQTDTSFFISRQAPAFALAARHKTTPYSTILPSETVVQENAALLAGGLLSGLGGALGQHAQNKQEEKMQANKFAHDEGMQSNMFDFNREMTQSQQDFQNMMQQSTFGYGFEMQEKNAASDLNLMRETQRETRETNALNTANALTARGLGSRTFALTSPVPGSSIA